MEKDKRAQLRVAALKYCMENAVVLGIGTILVVTHTFFRMPGSTS